MLQWCYSGVAAVLQLCHSDGCACQLVQLVCVMCMLAPGPDWSRLSQEADQEFSSSGDGEKGEDLEVYSSAEV